MMSTASVEPTDKPPVRWGPIDAVVIVFLIFILAQIAAISLIGIYPALLHWSAARASHWINNALVAQFVYVLIAETLSVAGLYGYIRFRHGDFRRGLGLTKPRWIDPLWTLIGVGVYYVVFFVAVTLLTNLIQGFNVNQKQNIGFNGSYSSGELVLVFISLVVLPPIVEEMLFRGFLFSGLKKAMPWVAAAVATSILFALPHLLEGANGQPLWIGGVDTFTLSLVLCWLRQKTDRLYASIGLHALKNGVAFMALYLIK